MRKVLFIVLISTLGSCRLFPSPAPPRFPQFSEISIAGPGTFQIPQWSSDGRYLAFMDVSDIPTLVVYDTQSRVSWAAATNIYTPHFSWGPNGDLTYLKYRRDLSGSPYPVISELHQVNLNGEADEIIATNLSSAGDFEWFSDGERIAILLTEVTSRTYFNDLYILNTTTGATDLLLEAEAVGLEYIVMFALSPDEQSVLVYGIQGQNDPLAAQIVIYDLETQIVEDRIYPSQIIPHANASYLWPGIGDGTNAGWVGGQRWFLAKTNTPSSDCYNYALFFFDMHSLQNSFCIPTVGGVFDYPVISPDFSRIGYVTVVGPGIYYVMIGDLTAEVLDRLELTND